jgi:mRNA interferase MazF
MKNLIIRRGDIFYAELSPVMGSEQGGLRPVLIVQNDIGNKYSPTVIAAAITSQINKAKLPTHIELKGFGSGLAKDSVILMEQVRTIDKKRLREKIGHIDEELLKRVNFALCISLGLPDFVLNDFAFDVINDFNYQKLQR